MIAEFLLEVGEDKIQKKMRMMKNIVLLVRTIEECIDFIFPTFDNPEEPFSQNCILFPPNEMIKKINFMCIRCFPGIMKEYYSFNAVSEETKATHFQKKFFDSL